MKTLQAVGMDVRQAIHPEHFMEMDTEEIRDAFLIDPLFVPGAARLTYSLFDRMIVGGIVPTRSPIALGPDPALATPTFFARREAGIINVGEAGTVTIDGTEWVLERDDALYIGAGVSDVAFTSADANAPAQFYLTSTRAHQPFPVVRVRQSEAKQVHLGDSAHSNERTIYQYVHPAVMPSCELAMGLTVLEPGCVWNTMPAHTHDRRMEVYLYLGLNEDQVVFHFCGEPEETRHIVVRNEQAVIVPNWSIHSGVGTGSYRFVWAMAGENQEFTDMDPVAMEDLA